MSEQLQEQGTTADAGVESGFTPITSQEDLDRIVGARVMRERDKYKDYAELKAKAARLDELEEANQTELEKAQKHAKELEAELAGLKAEKEIDGWKAQVSKETGVAAELLRGSTLEEIAEHAKSIKEAYPQHAAPVVRNDGGTSKGGQAATSGDVFASFAEANLFR